MAANWPITAADLRKELQIAPGSDDEDELELYVAVACERIDANTGRDLEPSRHEKGGNLPRTFILAARAAAALWWRQSKNGPRNRPGGQAGEMNGPPAGIDLPSKVKGWLTPYPPRVYPPEKPVFNPVTLTYPNGATVTFSREGDLVTALAKPPATGSPNNAPLPFPPGFSPAGATFGYLFALDAAYNAPGQWCLSIDESGLGGQGIGLGLVAFGSAPYSPFTKQWVADPA